jgi:hypothetical protein
MGNVCEHGGLIADFSDMWFQRAFMDIFGEHPMKALHTQEVMNLACPMHNFSEYVCAFPADTP